MLNLLLYLNEGFLTTMLNPIIDQEKPLVFSILSYSPKVDS